MMRWLKMPSGNGSQRVGGRDLIAGLGHRGEGPLLFFVEGAEVNAAFEKESAAGGQFRERVLQAVVDLGQQAGTQAHGEEIGRELDLVADADAAGHLEDLHLGPAPADADDLRLEFFSGAGHVGDFVHGHVAFDLDGDHVAVDPDDLSFSHFVSPCPLQWGICGARPGGPRCPEPGCIPVVNDSRPGSGRNWSFRSRSSSFRR